MLFLYHICMKDPILHSLDDYVIGQIWKDRVRKPTATFVVTDIIECIGLDQKGREYEVKKVVGVLSTHNNVQVGRELHPHSVSLMFPHLMWEAEDPDLKYDNK